MEKHIKVYIDGIPSITDSIKYFISLVKKKGQKYYFRSLFTS